MRRNKFSLSHYTLLTCNQGELVPVGCTEVLPGDTIQHATSALIRVSPLNAPVMHPVKVRIHHWFVPHRLVWEDFEDFITGGPDGLNASTFPTITVNTGTGWAIGSLADYLGVPTGVDDIAVSALPFRAYALIWNDWYRDQDLQTALTIDLTDGADTTTNTTLQNVCWEKDYFTTCRPWTQKGAEVSVPLGDAAPLEITAPSAGVNQIKAKNAAGTVLRSLNFVSGTPDARWDSDPGSNDNTFFSQAPNLQADLSGATAATVNELREAIAIQTYEENRALYGSRYVEYLRFLGVKSSDARLQRPEYLGGGQQTIQFSEVLQTGVTTDGSGTGVGNLKGHGISALRSNRYRRFFEEHGYVITLMSVQPRTMYAQGIPKHFLRSVKEDFFQKELQFVGQQEVLNKQLYAGHATPDGVFGYQNRYDEYRRTESRIAGEFRDSTYNFWHMARIFSGDPALNSTFVSSNPTNRIYQSTSSDQLLVMANHSMQARRLLDPVGKPGWKF